MKYQIQKYISPILTEKFSYHSFFNSDETKSETQIWENKEYLLKLIMGQCKINREDLKNYSTIKSKVRESKSVDMNLTDDPL